jgi:hypothetical protein
VNGDGYADLAVAASFSWRPMGRVYVYLGSATGLRATPSFALGGPDDGVSEYSPTGAGDLNGDGYADLVVGAPQAMRGEGRVHVYFGSAAGLPLGPSLSLTDRDASGGTFGASVASAGDLNGDGYADLVVLAHSATHAGRVHVYFGSAAGLSITPSLSLGGPDEVSYYGAVATDGDVNGDGYADLVVGGYRGMDLAQNVLVHFGSASGLSPTPSMSLVQPEERVGAFGMSLTSAADVNGDGYADLVAGDYGATVERGELYVYLGSAAGLSATPVLNLTGPRNGSRYFGSVLARAGAKGSGPGRRGRPPT